MALGSDIHHANVWYHMTPPDQDPVLGHAVDPAVREAHVDAVKFVYEQRLKLFNVRQEHEWRIFFAVAVLLGVVDAAILAHRALITGSQRPAWALACLMALLVCVGYEWQLQLRNRADRYVLDVACRRLCELGGVPGNSSLAWGVETPLRVDTGHAEDASGLWAFNCQVFALVLITGVAAALPWLRP
jgi:hypothetical protein